VKDRRRQGGEVKMQERIDEKEQKKIVGGGEHGL
jgi:hypothetical protein